MIHNSPKAKLILTDGTIFEGQAFGASTSKAGEVVFATGMTGYDQSLTDPSYKGQVLTFTYPLIGNWGVPPKDFWESEKIHAEGVIISDLTTHPNHWQVEKTLDDWLKEQNVPAIVSIDTRALTQKLREKGVMLGKIVVGDSNIDFTDPNGRNLVSEVSIAEPRIHHPIRRPEFISGSKYQIPKQVQNDKRKVKIGLLNCGAKRNIIRCLANRGATVYELPWNFDPFLNKLPIDGLVISNGPGDPKMAKESINIIKKALSKKLPTFGICLGNQLLALAAGGNTYKLKFGHRAQNQPTIEVGSKRCYITTQNHGFAVDDKKLPDGFRKWFTNANDGSNEGIINSKLPFMSVQFHPESFPGPTDTEFIFDYFFERINK